MNQFDNRDSRGAELSVEGRLLFESGLLLASTADGVGAFSLSPLEPLWIASGVPALAAADADCAYAYSRAGIVVAMGLDGKERWRTRVPDDCAPDRESRARREGLLPADAAIAGECIYVAAGGKVLALASRNGDVLAEAVACPQPRGVVLRLVRCRDALVVTCNQRSLEDDEPPYRGRLLWQPQVTPQAHRTSPGDLVAFDLELKERWRMSPPIPDLAYTDVPPVALADGSIGCVAANIVPLGSGHTVDLFKCWVFVVEAATGTIRWRRESETCALSPPEAVAVPGGLLAGAEPMLYARATGAPVWRTAARNAALKPGVTPILDGDRLLTLGPAHVVSIALADGSVTELAQLPEPGPPTTSLVVANGTLYVGFSRAGKGHLIGVRLS
jgi:outer membrane protein assembly factor BamB